MKPLMYQIYITSNVHLVDDAPLYQIAETDDETGEFINEEIVETIEDFEESVLKIKLKEMTANETIEYLANLLDTWSRVSIEWKEV